MPLYAGSLHACIMGMQQQNKPGYTKPGFHPQCQAHELLHMHTSTDWETEEERSGKNSKAMQVEGGGARIEPHSGTFQGEESTVVSRHSGRREN